MRQFFIVLAVLSLSKIVTAQTVSNKQFIVKYTEDKITLDGSLDEPIWEQAGIAKDFWQYFPTDTVQAKHQTEIRFLYSDRFLYVAIKVQALGKDYVVPSLRRDFRAGGSDNVTLMFDTFNDGINAFLFGTNPLGVRREALVSGGGTDLSGFTTSWDTKWKGETKIYDGYYISEWEIPLFSFKYKDGTTKWRFNCYQFDTQGNERNTWMQIPQNQFIFNLAYMGDMVFEKPLRKSKTPIALIPYVNGIASKDFEENSSFSDFKFGGDARLTIGTGLNLDLTFNPDFSQVEVDQQVTNLTRFEIGLPERRQFFIENSDLFATFGDDRDANPFFSRRIGIAEDIDGNTIENPIIAGARLSGKLNNNLRVGLINIQTEEDLANEIASNNNAVAVVQHKVFSRSNISAFFINRQAAKDYDFNDDNDDDLDNNSFNRVVGIDYNLASADNTWIGKYYVHKSFTPNIDSRDYSWGAATTYNSRNWLFRAAARYIGENFKSDLGFVRRTDIFRTFNRVERNFWPSDSKFNRHTISVTPTFFFRPELNFKNSDYAIFARYEGQLTTQEEFNVTLSRRYTFLFDGFDPTGSDGLELPIDRGYIYHQISANYRSDQRKKFSYSVNPSYGEFFNGNRFSFEGRANLRLQPYFTASMQVNYDKISLPDPFPSADIWLVGPRIDVTFNKSIFWATFIQYSNQRDNFSVNSRLQWRFAPLSDLFLVYNDNYFTETIAPKTRSINLKVTYWLNI
ncbi:DUF5916 domain-containing protein [Spongiivirga citrea]|uniref:Hydrolase n=1 Tax=Spongiivirga citrea TaxID=1481457 RepID=A0A6M0CSQ7_9FLAO|nr:DUF5916 domain-containing protein [Spongiivirga citrea]NER19124.1 hydrolase [Spongiivirga citrea]